MIAGRRRNHSSSPFFGREAKKLVQRSLLLERARHLQAFQLEEQMAIAHIAQQL